MRHPANTEVGVATHTGRVRTSNEDDFLLCAPQTPTEMARTGWFVAIADGMGGVTGGAEASRTAVRAAVRPHLAGDSDDPEERMRSSFSAAAREVYEVSRENPNLHGMGTTLTIINLLAGNFLLGHVGDTRCLQIRGGVLRQLSVDHAVREPDSFLTRCVGAGQLEVEVDISAHDLEADDRLLLLTDGLWGTVPEEEIRRIALALPPQDAADELVRHANRCGGADNSTVIILHVRSTTEAFAVREVELPTEEVREPALLRQPDRRLLPARWPWFVLGAGLVLLTLAIAKAAFGIDVFGDLLSLPE